MPLAEWFDPTDVTPDNTAVVGAKATGKDSETDLYVVPFDVTQQIRKLLPTSADRTNGRFSPDGTVLVWAGGPTGEQRPEVYIQPYPALDRLVRVSNKGGFRVAWAREGRRLAFRYGDSLDVVDVRTDPQLSVSQPVVSMQDLPDSRFDVSPDGTRFLMATPAGGSKPVSMIQVEEGFEQRVRDALRKANAK